MNWDAYDKSEPNAFEELAFHVGIVAYVVLMVLLSWATTWPGFRFW